MKRKKYISNKALDRWLESRENKKALRKSIDKLINSFFMKKYSKKMMQVVIDANGGDEVMRKKLGMK